jgi:hypothetical protein
LEHATGRRPDRVAIADQVDRLEMPLVALLEAELARIESAATAATPESGS